MKKILGLLVVALTSSLLSCGSGEEANLEVTVPTSPLPLIPANATSCLSRKSAVGESPAQDISPSYFRIPTLKFTRKNTTKTLIISLVRITIRIPTTGATVRCEIGGDALAALATSWWATSNRETSVPVGTSTFSTDCPLYCGGVDTTRTFVASGPLEIFGLERDESTLEESPVKVQSMVSIQSF